MDRKSRSFKLLTLAQKQSVVLKDVTNNRSQKCTKKPVANTNFLVETDAENLQSAVENLLEEVQKTQILFDLEEHQDLLSPDYVDSIISNGDEIDNIIDSDIFSEDMVNKADKIWKKSEHIEEGNKVPDTLNEEHVVTDKIINKENENTVAEGTISHTSEEEVVIHNNSLHNAENIRDSSDAEVAPPRKRAKKRLSDPKTWKYNINKGNTEKGMEYMGRKNNKFEINKNRRELKMRCSCKAKATRTVVAKIMCYKLSEEDRREIFTKFWHLTWPERKIYVSTGVLKTDIKRARHRRNTETSQRTASYQYFLNRKSENVRVCKTMFCNTLGVSVRTISEWVKEDKSISITNNSNPNNRDENSKRKGSRFTDRKEDLLNFFTSLPKLESHYCRKSTQKLYLEPRFKTKSELYALYKDGWCVDHTTEALCIATFSNMFEDLNLSLFSPKKDECDVCVGYKTKNIEENVYMEHIAKKEEARKEKAEDKISTNKVFTMDLQSVLLCPKSNVSALYYRTKLIVHNFTIFDLGTKDGYCFLWHEGEGELSANCFSSIICNFLCSKIIPHLESNQQIIIQGGPVYIIRISPAESLSKN